MTPTATSAAPTPTATATARWPVAVAVAAPALLAVSDLISPIDTSSGDSSAERLADILEHSGRYGLTVTCLLAGILLMVPATLALAGTVTAPPRRLARRGAVVAAAGFMLFAVNIGAIGIGPTAWTALSDADQLAARPAFAAVDEGKGLMPVPITGSFLLPLAGLSALTVALWRTRTTRRARLLAVPLGWAIFLLGPLPAVRSAGAVVLLAGLVTILAPPRHGDRAAHQGTQ